MYSIYLCVPGLFIHQVYLLNSFIFVKINTMLLKCVFYFVFFCGATSIQIFVLLNLSEFYWLKPLLVKKKKVLYGVLISMLNSRVVLKNCLIVSKKLVCYVFVIIVLKKWDVLWFSLCLKQKQNLYQMPLFHFVWKTAYVTKVSITNVIA